MEIHGEEKVRDYWIKQGSRNAGKYFGVSPWTISHCVKKFGWKRPMENAPHILTGVARGKLNPKDYPHLEFKVPKSVMLEPQKNDIQKHAYYLLKKGTFIGWCLLNDGYTYCREIYM